MIIATSWKPDMPLMESDLRNSYYDGSTTGQLFPQYNIGCMGVAMDAPLNAEASFLLT